MTTTRAKNVSQEPANNTPDSAADATSMPMDQDGPNVPAKKTARKPRKVNTKAQTTTKRTLESGGDGTSSQDVPDKPGPPKKARTAGQKPTKSAKKSADAAGQNTVTVESEEGNTPDLPPKKPRRARRTKAEMDAARQEAELQKKKNEELQKAKERQLLKMNIDEDRNRREAEDNTVRRLSDIEDSGKSESFPELDDIMDISDSDEEVAATVSKVERLKHKLQQLEAGLTKDGKTKTKRSGQQTIIASGLRPDWQKQISKRPTAARKVAGTVKKGRPMVTPKQGLGDSDIEDANPYKREAPVEGGKEGEVVDVDVDGKVVARSNRQNKLVQIAESVEDEVEFVPPVARRTIRVPVKKATMIKATDHHQRVQNIGSSKAVQKRETDLEEPVVRGRGATPQASLPGRYSGAGKATSKAKFTGNTARVSDLPDFAVLEWHYTFLPTLYDKFFSSSEPFSGFFKGSDDFVGLLQVTVEEVYPGIDYPVTRMGPIHAIAYKRVNEKRSLIGSTAVSLIQRHIATLGDGMSAADWLCWALRTDGPLYYRVPSPIDSPINHKDPNYVYPEGRLLSRFIIELVGPMLGLKKGSVSDNGYPRGLFALILAALERAVKAVLRPLEVKEFSNEYWGSKAKIYFNSLRPIHDTRWKEVFNACGIDEDKDIGEDVENANLSILDADRALMFERGSPVKA